MATGDLALRRDRAEILLCRFGRQSGMCLEDGLGRYPQQLGIAFQITTNVGRSRKVGEVIGFHGLDLGRRKMQFGSNIFAAPAKVRACLGQQRARSGHRRRIGGSDVGAGHDLSFGSRIVTIWLRRIPGTCLANATHIWPAHPWSQARARCDRPEATLPVCPGTIRNNAE